MCGVLVCLVPSFRFTTDRIRERSLAPLWRLAQLAVAFSARHNGYGQVPTRLRFDANGQTKTIRNGHLLLPSLGCGPIGAQGGPEGGLAHEGAGACNMSKAALAALHRHAALSELDACLYASIYAQLYEY